MTSLLQQLDDGVRGAKRRSKPLRGWRRHALVTERRTLRPILPVSACTRESDLFAMSSYSLAAWWCCRARCNVSDNSVSALMHSYNGVR